MKNGNEIDRSLKCQNYLGNSQLDITYVDDIKGGRFI